MAEAWQIIGQRLGLQVVQRGDESIAATGTVRGRAVSVSIEGRQVGSELLRSFAPTHRKRVHQRWNTGLMVSCRNPHGLSGSVEIATDANDPSWNPRIFDPSQCRSVRSSPPDLADVILPPRLRDQLTPVLFDPRFDVTHDSVRLVTKEHKVGIDGGYFVGSPIHVNYPDAPQPWPERAVAGPIWWIAVLCDIADLVDG